jgi:Ala-tRNA(Pro) deacylase
MRRLVGQRDAGPRQEAFSMDVAAVRAPHAGLVAWLREQGVDHEIHEHTPAFTAATTAKAEGVDVRTFAKVIGVATDDGRSALFVVDAPDRVDLHKARELLGAKEVRLLTEAELEQIAPGCDAGAVPAVGLLFELPMYADHAIADDMEISFNAGTHRHSVRVDRRDWEHAAHVRYADIAVEADERPAWAHS